MTDDKAVEAALDAWEEIDEGEWASDYGANRKSAMRAALAAADKVRAKGFDPQAKARGILESVSSLGATFHRLPRNFQLAVERIEPLLIDIFSSGLAKGEADRAIIEKVRDEWCAEYTKERDDSAVLVEVLQWYADNSPLPFCNRAVQVLALVRKGV